ncbi:MAG: response regulator [Bacteriovoracaceae bacterium]|nr:response regulator [Bacteriovoracaceae bacterium]
MNMPVNKRQATWTIESLAAYVSEIVAKDSGNVLGDKQQSMVVSRLRKRLLDLGGLTPTQYAKELETNYKKESSYLISLLTTHHTFFFREVSHFDFVLENLDKLVASAKKRGDNKIRVLSAACSKGQEVYSLAMFLNLHLKKYPGMDFEILGTDIDPECVKIGNNGVYQYQEVKTVPRVYLQGNWQRGTGKIADFVKVKSHLKERCSFDVMNLLTAKRTLQAKKFDLIFCRNVFIYFKRDDIVKIVKDMQKHVHVGGYFITGLSESIKELNIAKQNLAPSVYSFDEPVVVAKPVGVVAPKVQVPVTKSLTPKPIKMLVVDDSSSVVKLLSKIFQNDPEFELVGTAKNGVEAAEFVKNNSVDAMTLDIHMPEMDGVEYLKKHHSSTHPKVVVVSSASREDTRYAQQTLRHGASDFVEKPALNNLKERAEEIKNKIKMSFLNEASSLDGIDKSFQKDFSIQNCSQKGRLFFGNFSDLKKIKACLNELKGDQPPIVVVFEGNGNYLDMIKDELGSSIGAQVFEEDTALKSNQVYLSDFAGHMGLVKKQLGNNKTSCSVFGICSSKVVDSLLGLDNAQILLEDLPNINKDLKEVASDVFPWTSFPHVGTEYLAKE